MPFKYTVPGILPINRDTGIVLRFGRQANDMDPRIEIPGGVLDLSVREVIHFRDPGAPRC